jgi:hypothetical protein
MDEAQLKELLGQIGPSRLLLIIQMVMQMDRQTLEALVQQLSKMAQQEQGGSPEPATPGPAQAQQEGQRNMYGR